MADSWHSCIASDLECVEEIVEKSGRSDDSELTKMCQYVLSNHGKRIRPAMCLLAFHACGGQDLEKAVNVGSAIELIHNATLIHDDINDQGELRRGAKVLYREYSLGKSVVCGDYMFAMGFKLLGATTNELVNFIIEAASGLATGEFSQKKYERNVAVNETEYMKIISGKTARLFECAAKCGAYIAGNRNLPNIEALGNFAFKAGQTFQIVDDILDVVGVVGNTGKRAGNDIVEGKPTLPIIYGIRDPVCGPKIRDIFQEKESDYDSAAVAIDLIKKTDSIARCCRLAETIAESAKTELDCIPDSVYKQGLIGLADYIVARDR